MNEDFNPNDIMEIIQGILKDGKSLHITEHAMERMDERGITRPDLYYLFENGSCMAQREPSTKKNLWKYKITGKTPNTDNREITSVTIIPDNKGGLKVVTIYWND